jgi:ADP-ribose pyrophosphatase YjhB (NUDIX family)
MMQKYKVFYKSKEIVFCSIGQQITQTEECHTLINPENHQLMAALSACFIERHDISTLHIISSKPNEAFDHFVKSLFLIEAAGGIITNEHREWLIIKRSGVWDLPKGKIDPGETSQIAAIREVKEETGIESVSIIKELTPSYHIYPMDHEWVFKKTYWYLMLGSKGRLKPQKEEKISEAVWMNENSVKKIANGMYPSLLHVIIEAGVILEPEDGLMF